MSEPSQIEGDHYFLQQNGGKKRVAIFIEIPTGVDWREVGNHASAAAYRNINNQQEKTFIAAACAYGGGW